MAVYGFKEVNGSNKEIGSWSELKEIITKS